MSQLLKDKVAFITGSASGIGHEIAKKFANEGARVVISDMNAEKCAETVFALQKEGFDALSAPCDVTDEEAYRAAIELTQKTYGRLDILINNAGFQHVAVIEDFPTAVYQKLINAFRNLYEHHLILRIEDQDEAAVEAFLESYFDHHETGDYFLCDEDEGRKAFLLMWG